MKKHTGAHLEVYVASELISTALSRRSGRPARPSRRGATRRRGGPTRKRRRGRSRPGGPAGGPRRADGEARAVGAQRDGAAAAVAGRLAGDGGAHRVPARGHAHAPAHRRADEVARRARARAVEGGHVGARPYESGTPYRAAHF